MPISSQALRRRAKKFLRQHRLQMYVPTLPGFEQVTAAELGEYAQHVQTSHGGVSFEGDLLAIYRANLSTRTGSRILLRLSQFLSQSYPMLYDHARSIDWVAILGNCPEIGIRVTSRESRLSHKSHLRETIYSAILARTEGTLIEPRLGRTGLLTIHASLYRDRCTLSLDTTGTHLHKRGYRTFVSAAPIRETTAAALLLMANLNRYDLVVDPFCGAGTFLIEAELIARNYPPGAQREFAFESSPLHAPGTLRHARRLLLEKASASTTIRILGSDASTEAVFAAQRNAAQAEAHAVSISHENALDIDLRRLKTTSSRALLISNMPYGKRLTNLQEARDLFDRFSSVLARGGQGWEFVLVAPEGFSIRHSGLVIDRRAQLMNAGLRTVAIFGHVAES